MERDAEGSGKSGKGVAVRVVGVVGVGCTGVISDQELYSHGIGREVCMCVLAILYRILTKSAYGASTYGASTYRAHKKYKTNSPF